MEPVYYYIADSNPDDAVHLLTSKYNYRIDDNFTVEEIAQSLQDIVNTDGEMALRDVMNIHPDKAVILELNSSAEGNSSSASNATTAMPSVPSLQMYQSRGEAKYERGFLNSPTNVLIVAALILAGVALAKK